MPGNANESLILACRRGDAQGARQLIDDGADACYQGCNSLMAASEGGNMELIRLLLETGVPWNALDKAGRCAGEYAQQCGNEDVFNALLEAGIQAELLLGLLERQAGRSEQRAASAAYLAQDVTYDHARAGGAVLSDEASRAVMMQWEGPLMQAHARAVCSQGGKVLNVGFGLGLVDTAIQDESQPHRPSTHTIIEAHAGVIAKMKADGWHEKPGVSIAEGRWQDVIDKLGQFDGIFFDTYSEFYGDLREFHQHLPRILKANGLYSFFNGLAADNPFFHMVYCELVKRELAVLGLETEYISLPVPACTKDVWDGVQNCYWQLDTYQLPIVQWASKEDEDG